MSASSDLLPQAKTEPLGVGEDTNPPRAVDERTVANGGAPPMLLSQLTLRAITFRPSEHAGDLGRLDRYRVLRQLGKGGMGAVYLGFDERLRRKVALKVMLPDAAADPQSKERFLREARAAAQIAHDNVIAIHEADEADGIPYIAMQYLQGYPLDEYLAKKGRPSFAQIVRIGREVALGLAAAHKLGLVHRDIKPGNIWLEAPHGRVKILDFGLARPAKTSEGELTQSGTVVGTPAYMAPEQARGHKVDGRADLFSLGVLLYRLASNRLPFDGPDVMAMLTALAVEEPRPVHEWNPATPKPLADLIHELLAKKPTNRPQTADEVSARLHSLGDRAATNHVVYVPMPVTVVGSESNAFENIVDETTLADSPEASGRREAPRSAKRPWLLIAAGLLAMIAGGGVLVALLGNDPKPEARVEEKPAKKPVEPAKPIKKPDAPAVFDHAPFPKLDPNWLKTVSALPFSDILGPVNEELKRRNPGYDGKGLTWTNDPLTGTRTALELISDHVTDLMPLLAVPGLDSLELLYTGKAPSKLTSLAPLRGLKTLRYLRLDGHPELTDLAPLANLPIERLSIAKCGVESLEPLRTLPLDKLDIPLMVVRDFQPLAKLPLRSFTFGHPDLAQDLTPLASCPLEHVRIEWGLGMDLTPLRRCPLRSFTMVNTAQPDLAPLEGSSIEDFSGFDPIQYEAFLRRLPKLATVGSYNAAPLAADVYFANAERFRTERAALIESFRKLPTPERIVAVRNHYFAKNDGKKSTFNATVENGEVVAVDFTGSDPYSACWNLGYLNAFPKLKSVTFLGIYYAPLFHQLLDLPIEDVTIPGNAMHIEANLHSFARMKSLKAVNGMPIEQFAERWRLVPGAPRAAAAPPTADLWRDRVATLPPAEALAEVAAELRRRNPGFEGTVEPANGEENALTAVRVVSSRLVDLAPLLALKDLSYLALSGMGKESSPLVDLAPLAKLPKLRRLELSHHPSLADIAPLADVPLTNFTLHTTGVADLAPFRGSSTIRELNIHNSPIRSLEPVRGWPLQSLWFGHPDIVHDLAPLADCPLENITVLGSKGLDLTPLAKCPLKSFAMHYVALPDLAPLAGSNLERFSAYDPFQFEPLLKTMPKLREVTAYNLPHWIPREQYFADSQARAKANDAFLASVAGLDAAARIDAVKKRFESHKQNRAIELELILVDGEVDGIVLTGDGSPVNVWDLALFRAFPKLRTFKSELPDDVALLHGLVGLPIEELSFPARGDIHIRLNLDSLATMTSLKRVNGVPIADFATRWNLKPTPTK